MILEPPHEWVLTDVLQADWCVPVCKCRQPCVAGTSSIGEVELDSFSYRVRSSLVIRLLSWPEVSKGLEVPAPGVMCLECASAWLRR